MAELFLIAATFIAAIYFTRQAVVSFLEFEEALNKPLRELEDALREAKESRQ